MPLTLVKNRWVSMHWKKSIRSMNIELGRHISKLYLILILSFICSYVWAGERKNEYLRQLYIRSTKQEASVDTLIYAKFSYTTLGPLELGYIGSGYFIKCNYLSNPWYKFKYFNIGKQKLELAISQSRDQVELRYLRYTLQTNLPSLLNYNGNKKEDYRLLQGFLSNKQNLEIDADLYNKIKQYLADYPL